LSFCYIVSGAKGKTTALGFIQQALYKSANVVPVSFNPWRFSDKTSLLLSCFSTLASALDKSTKTAKAKIGDILRTYGDAVGEIAVEANGVKISASHGISKIGEKLSLVTLEEERARIENMLKETEKRATALKTLPFGSITLPQPVPRNNDFRMNRK
jgi:predicted KAP-like P-loop ATPase